MPCIHQMDKIEHNEINHACECDSHALQARKGLNPNRQGTKKFGRKGLKQKISQDQLQCLVATAQWHGATMIDTDVHTWISYHRIPTISNPPLVWTCFPSIICQASIHHLHFISIDQRQISWRSIRIIEDCVFCCVFCCIYICNSPFLSLSFNQPMKSSALEQTKMPISFCC